MNQTAKKYAYIVGGVLLAGCLFVAVVRGVQESAEIYVQSGMIEPNYSLEGFLYNPMSQPDEDWIYWTLGIGGAVFLVAAGTVLFLGLLNKRLASLVQQKTRALEQRNQQLRESEERYRRIVETAQEGIWLIDLQGKTLFVNERMAAMLGYTVAEIYAASVFEFTDSQQHQETLSSLQRRRQGVGELLERCLIRKDGSRLWTLNSTSPIRDEQGQVIGSMGMLTDITARKQAEEALREHRQQLQLAIQATNLGLWDWKLKTQVFWGDQRWAAILGYTLEEASQSPDFWQQRVHPEDLPEGMAAWNAYLSGKTSFYKHEYRVRHKSGGWRWVAAYGIIAERDHEGTPLRVIGAVQDITSRKQAEEALQENEVRYQKAQRLGNVGNWEYNFHTAEFWGSEQAKRIYGFDPEADRFTTEEVEGCIPERVRVHQALVELIEQEQEYNLEFDILTHDTGERKTIVSLAELEKDAQGNPLKVTGVIQDITERKRAEEQVNAALREKEALLREIHHRVKNNLMVVTSLIQMQTEQTTNPDALALFRDLYNRILAMAMVHEDLYQSHNLAQIDFGTYLQRLVINIRQGFSRTDAAIKIAASDIFLDIHHAIPCGLIVAELVTNAFKYAFQPSSRLRSMTGGSGSLSSSPVIERSRDEIRVEMHKTDDAYILIVSDNGVGLPPGFDIQKQRTLGMTLVRSWVVHQLKGSLEVDNRSGATFRISFTAR